MYSPQDQEGRIFGNLAKLPLLNRVGGNLLHSISILSNSLDIFTEKLVKGIVANKEKCENYIEGSLAMCTSLVPIIGYDKAASIAYESFKSGKTIREVMKEKKIIDDKTLQVILDPKNMIKPK